MVALTQSSLDKLELLFKEQGYRLRFEKGSFRTGACMLQNSKVIVVNKFSSVDVKVQSLIQIFLGIPIEEELIEEKLRPFYQQIKKTNITV